MSLVPIIYTSILIFSGFLLFVIIVSYISYKTKSRDRIPVHLKNYDPLGNRLAYQPIAANGYNQNIVRQEAFQYVIPIQSNNHSKKQDESSRKENNSLRLKQESLKRNYDPKIIKEVEKSKNATLVNVDSAYQPRRFKTTQHMNRLEIINHSEKFNISEPAKVENYSGRGDKRYTGQGDVNLISYYSDKPEHDYTSFSAPRIQQAI